VTMHCTNCGSYIAPGVRFCAGCGTPIVDPEATRVSGAAAVMRPETGDVGRTIFTARPTLLFIKVGYLAAALGAIAVTAILASFTSFEISAVASIAVALSLFLIPAYYHLKRNSVRYKLTDSEIEIDRGLLSRTTRNIPLRAIQDVTVSAGIFQRLLGYGDIIIDNSDDIRGTITLHNVHSPRKYADLLLKELRQRR
jgi:membrane protein YdbS with pleckstrin-like domain